MGVENECIHLTDYSLDGRNHSALLVPAKWYELLQSVSPSTATPRAEGCTMPIPADRNQVCFGIGSSALHRVGVTRGPTFRVIIVTLYGACPIRS